MTAKSAVLSYHASKNCFVNLPQSWASKLPREKVLVFELQSESGSLYTSWAGGISVASDNELDSVEINGLFSIKQNLNHGDELLISQLSTVSVCSQVYVEPVSITDWEILEENAEYIEGNLLQQVRAVWLGQIIPIWIHKSICIFVKIGKTVPSTKCCLLEENSEVIVTPKARNAQPTKTTPKRTPKGETTNDISSITQNSRKTTTESPDVQERSEVDSLHVQTGRVRNLSGNKFVENLKTAATKYEDENKSISASRENLRAELETETADIQSSQKPGIIRRISSYVSSWWSGETTNVKEISETKTSIKEVKYEKEFLEGIFDCSLRVHSLDSAVEKLEQWNSRDLSEGSMLDFMVKQSFNVFISSETFSKNANVTCQTLKPFLATLTKLPSPVEREQIETKKTAAAKTKLSAAASKSGDVKPTNLELSNLLEDHEATRFIVRVVVLDHNKFIPQLRNFSDGITRGNSLKLSQISEGHVLLSDLLRSQLDIPNSSRVRLTALNHEMESLKRINFHPLFTLPSGFSRDMIQLAIKNWVESCSDVSCPHIVNQASVVRIPLKHDLSGAFLVTCPSFASKNTPYNTLSAAVLDNVKLTIGDEIQQDKLPERISRIVHGTEHSVDLPIPRINLDQLGGDKTMAQEAIQHMEICLCQRMILEHMFRDNPGLCNGGLLICGTKGVGKTSLGRALCRYATEWPNLAYVSTLDCKGLKGKRIESIRKLFEKVFHEAIWRQPAVILLDDLDHVTAAPAGPEQEMSGEAVYYTRVAEVLKDVLSMTIERKAKVIVIATSRSRSSVHQSLVASRGKHYIQEVIDMTTPDQKGRVSILKAILVNKPVVSAECIDDLDIESVASRTEGYVSRDLDMVIDRAIHAYYMLHPKTPSGTKQEIKLSLSDLEAALDGFTPAALKNVSLHKAGELGWKHVGGLDEVKKTIVETLQWPAKYPKLFASCPLRLRSGLLLYGAPGTGKTLLAGVVANECGLNFISIKGPELLSKYIGASELAVRDTFIRAQSAKPCVLFFDEFDSLAPRRGHDSTGVTDRVVNQLLTQLDGVEGLEGVYVLAATSRPDLIDPALLRPGRLDKALHCPIPDQEERLAILRALTHGMDLSSTVNLEYFAENCEYFTGADFKALLYNAQLEAIHEITGQLRQPEIGYFPELLDAETGDATQTEDCGSEVMSVVLEKSQDKRVIHIPSLESGSVQLSTEKEQLILDEFNKPEAPSGESKSRHATVIEQRHLVTALETMGPSVSVTERQKYRIIYENFIQSRGGNFSDGTQSVGKKATLA